MALLPISVNIPQENIIDKGTHMKIDRLLGIIQVLMKEEKVTAPYLAELFEVSRRTINRDIDAILMAGIPIMTEQGYHGGIWIDEHYKVNQSLLTKNELQAIFTGLKSLDSVFDNAYSTSLKQKLSLQDSTYFMEDDFLMIDLASYYKGEIAKKIKMIQAAIRSRKTISFQYYNERGSKAREIEPHVLTYQWSSWYVIGYCLKRQTFRMFKLNRLYELAITKTSFAYRQVPNDIFCIDFPKADIELKAYFSNQVIYRVIDEYGMDSVIRHNDECYYFQMKFQNFDYLVHWIKSFGSEVEVMEPKQLQQELFDDAKRIVKKYERHDI